MGEKEIRDLTPSEEEGEDVKGGRVEVGGPLPPEKNPGGTTSTAPIAPGTMPPGAVPPKKGGGTSSTGKDPGRLPPGS